MLARLSFIFTFVCEDSANSWLLLYLFYATNTQMVNIMTRPRIITK